jgi:hypothetical protein
MITIDPLSLKDLSHVASTSWLQRLDSAHSEGEIVAAAREFLAAIAPEEIEALPAASQPPLKLVDGNDIAGYAFDLVRSEQHQGVDTSDLLHRLARFFSHASIRLSQVQAHAAIAKGNQRASA